MSLRICYLAVYVFAMIVSVMIKTIGAEVEDGRRYIGAMSPVSPIRSPLSVLPRLRTDFGPA
jgi:hypothetical protein